MGIMVLFAPIGLLALLLVPQQGLPDGNIVRDQWETLEFQGKRLGSRHLEFHTFPKEEADLPKGSRKIRETLTLEMNRFGQPIKLKQVREDLEDASGNLLGATMEQSQNHKITLQLKASKAEKGWILLNIIL